MGQCCPADPGGQGNIPFRIKGFQHAALISCRARGSLALSISFIQTGSEVEGAIAGPGRKLILRRCAGHKNAAGIELQLAA